MHANIGLNPTQNTLDQIVREALPILKVLGFEVAGRGIPKAGAVSTVSPEDLVQEIQIMDPHVLWK